MTKTDYDSKTNTRREVERSAKMKRQYRTLI